MGSKVGLLLLEEHVQLFIDDIGEEPLPWVYPVSNPCYVIFDLYGQCQQVLMIT